MGKIESDYKHKTGISIMIKWSKMKDDYNKAPFSLRGEPSNISKNVFININNNYFELQ